MFAIDGLDATGLIGFDEALEGNGYLDGGETVQVILGAADEPPWESGTNPYYAVRWTGPVGSRTRDQTTTNQAYAT